MARTVFGILIVAAAFAQAAVLPEVLPVAIAPGPVLVLVFLWSIRRGMYEAAFWAFGIGILLDLLALDPLGANGLALLGAVVLGVPARRRFFQSSLVVPLLLVAVATVLQGLVLLGVRGAVDNSAVPLTSAVRVIVPQALLNVVLLPVLYPISGWLGRRVDVRI